MVNINCNKILSKNINKLIEIEILEIYKIKKRTLMARLAVGSPEASKLLELKS